ncbi:DNA helicase rad5 [Ceratobasidium sp. UAMH 11750]|nr:DNA helicase rad5 [Ceratobasidium sp. UAMH 11750]
MGKSIMMSSAIHTSRNEPTASSKGTSSIPGAPSNSALLAAFGKRKRIAANDAPAVEPHATLLIAPNQIVELPPKIMTIEELTFSPAERRAYEEVYTTAKKEFGDMGEVGTVSMNFTHMFAQIMRLRQAVLHPDLIKASKPSNDDEDVVPDSEDGAEPVVSNPKPTTSLQTLGHGAMCFEPAESSVTISQCGHAGCERCFENFRKMCQEKEDALVCPVRRTPIKDNPPWGPTKDLNQDEAGSIDRGDNLVLASQKSTSNKDEFRSSTKIDALLRNLRELRENDPSLWAIVFSQVNKLPNLFALKIAQTKNLALQFTSFLDIIQKALARDGFESLRLDGTMSQQQRSRSLQTFKSPDPTPKIFCISLRAGGVGLNLTQAQHVFMMDFWWNRAVENQAIDRVSGPGQVHWANIDPTC